MKNPSSRDELNGAIFDASRRYRYLLWRTWDADLPRACFVMLNPSTADGESNDPTIRRCIGLTRRNGFGGIDVVNLFAHRATHPKALPRTAEARGPANTEHLHQAIERCTVTIAGWGMHGAGEWQAMTPLANRQLLCFGETARGEPRHPLYLAGDAILRPWVRTSRAVCRPGG